MAGVNIKTLATILLLLLLSFAAIADTAESFEYRAVTPSDLDRVLADWANRDTSAQNVLIVHDEHRDDFRLIIVRHDVGSRAHFSALLVPDVEDLSATPVVVLPDGLEQHNPAYDIDIQIQKHQSFEPLDQYEPLETMKGFIQVLPALRGRTLNYNGTGWFSRGDFCDAFDGATDDSMAALSAAEHLFPEANFRKVLVWGGSRGGNTALLMAVRDARVNTVIAAAAPVDFYREEWQVGDSDQNRCQFFDDKSEQESRTRMLASSPLFFEPHKNLENAFLHHDRGDDIFPVWNAQEMAAHLESHSVQVTQYIYDTQAHSAMLGEESHWTNLKFGVAKFLQNIGN